MLQNTRGIVLRSIKYGETSLISTIFTEFSGVQAYLVQGVRSANAKNKAALLQPATLLELVSDMKAQKNLQRLREFHPAYIAKSLQQEVLKNSAVLFSVELLFRLLPEHAPMPELFDFSFEYFINLDQQPVEHTANFPLYFIMNSSRLLGFELQGRYSPSTPYLNLYEGGFSDHPPMAPPYVSDEDTRELQHLLNIRSFSEVGQVAMNGAIRSRLLDWYVEYLHQHTQHLNQLKSLAVLRAILR